MKKNSNFSYIGSVWTVISNLKKRSSRARKNVVFNVNFKMN